MQDAIMTQLRGAPRWENPLAEGEAALLQTHAVLGEHAESEAHDRRKVGCKQIRHGVRARAATKVVCSWSQNGCGQGRVSCMGIDREKISIYTTGAE